MFVIMSSLQCVVLTFVMSWDQLATIPDPALSLVERWGVRM